jgi:hypothetical protein
LLSGKHWFFGGIYTYTYNNFVEQIQASVDDVHVSQCKRVKCSWKKADALHKAVIIVKSSAQSNGTADHKYAEF